jgi:hypothetical protein
MPDRTFKEPPVIDIDDWLQLAAPVLGYARRVSKYYANQPVSIGVEIVGGDPPTYRVWRSETRNGVRFYELQLDTTPERDA